MICDQTTSSIGGENVKFTVDLTSDGNSKDTFSVYTY